MNKILKSLSVIAFVGAVALAGTGAYFSDVETSLNNTFTAGTIDIAIDTENPFTDSFDIGDLKPGEVGYINFRINNVGENPVDVSKKLYNFEYTDVTDEEGLNVDGYACGDVTGPTGSAVPYIASSEPECEKERDVGFTNNVETKILYDLSVEVYDGTSDATPIWWQTIYAVDGTNGLSLYDVYGNENINFANSVDLGMIPVDGYMMVTQSYHFSATAENEYQGDGLMFDMEIRADQLTGEGGMATVILEDKTYDSANDTWTINGGDDVLGTLNYKTQGPLFDYNFTGSVKTNGNYTLIYVGDTNDYPCTGSVILGEGYFTVGTGLTISGQVDTGDIDSGKIWLIPTSSYDSNIMTSWPVADILLETGLINYDQN